MNKPTFDESFELAVDLTKQAWNSVKSDEDATPFLMIAGKNKGYIVPTADLQNRKEQWRDVVLPAAIKKLQAHHYVVSLSAWMSVYSKDEDLSNKPTPANDLRAKEVVVVSGCTPTETRLVIYHVVRKHGEAPSLELLPEMDSMESFTSEWLHQSLLKEIA